MKRHLEPSTEAKEPLAVYRVLSAIPQFGAAEDAHLVIRPYDPLPAVVVVQTHEGPAALAQYLAQRSQLQWLHGDLSDPQVDRIVRELLADAYAPTTRRRRRIDPTTPPIRVLK